VKRQLARVKESAVTFCEKLQGVGVTGRGPGGLKNGAPPRSHQGTRFLKERGLGGEKRNSSGQPRGEWRRGKDEGPREALKEKTATLLPSKYRQGNDLGRLLPLQRIKN